VSKKNQISFAWPQVFVVLFSKPVDVEDFWEFGWKNLNCHTHFVHGSVLFVIESQCAK
jgi:hypothetical protein